MNPCLLVHERYRACAALRRQHATCFTHGVQCHTCAYVHGLGRDAWTSYKTAVLARCDKARAFMAAHEDDLKTHRNCVPYLRKRHFFQTIYPEDLQDVCKLCLETTLHTTMLDS